MTILEFMNQFPDEVSCRLHFKENREKQGIICKHCGGNKHYWLSSKCQWQCANCEFRTTLRSGTVMENSNLPFMTWYLCMAFMSFSKKGVSALEMQRQLGHNRYETIWKLMHKIRNGMGKRDNLYVLKDMIEADEGYFECATSNDGEKKRGRGSEGKHNVMVLAESTPLEDINTGKKSSHCRYFKMKVLESHKATDVNQVVATFVHDKAIIFSDNSTSYVDFDQLVEGHIYENSTKELTKTTLKWVHIAISNAKRTLLGIYHMIKITYLQAYLDEFCYKLNRRYFGEKLFDRLIIAAIKI